MVTGRSGVYRIPLTGSLTVAPSIYLGMRMIRAGFISDGICATAIAMSSSFTTVSRSIDFGGIAAACGYPKVHVASTGDELATCVGRASREEAPGLTFVHVPLIPGIEDALPRPSISPPEVAARLRSHLS